MSAVPRRLTADELDAWRAIAPAVASDERAHQGVLAGIRPLFEDRAFAGQALTIEVTPDGNGTPREALATAWPGAVIVIDATRTPDAAVWGGNLIAIAATMGVAAIVVDGNVRDVSDMRASTLAVASRGITPRGPNWTGHIGGTIRCGGVQIAPGDLLLGDDDGVISIPLASATDELLARCRARIARQHQELQERLR